MHTDTLYVHALEGRLRIKIPEVKGVPLKALEIETHIKELAGVKQVSANPTTGNVLILYDSRRLKQNQIISVIQGLGYLKQAGPEAVRLRQESFASKVANSVTQSIMETVLLSVVSALI